MQTNGKALCVGINKFQYLPPNAFLNGCVNDAQDMSELLTTQLGFKKDDITILLDSKATKANIMKNLKEIVQGANKGNYNYVVFSCSSHGSFMTDKNNDEPDHVDEVFCPYDTKDDNNGSWDPDHVIIDDELRDLFSQLPSDVLLEAFLDTCHSGTGLRALDLLTNRKIRFIPPPSAIAINRGERIRGHGMREALLEKDMKNHILWSGCKSDQTSADAIIEGQWHGAFTYYLNKFTKTQNKGMTRKGLITKVRKDLKTENYTQIPQLECNTKFNNLTIGRMS